MLSICYCCVKFSDKHISNTCQCNMRLKGTFHFNINIAKQ